MPQAAMGLYVSVIRNLLGSPEFQVEEAARGSEMVKWPLMIAFLSPLRL